jgi:hypothetical protein
MAAYPLEAVVHFILWDTMIYEVHESKLLEGAVHLGCDGAFVVDGATVKGRKINDRHGAERRRD